MGRKVFVVGVGMTKFEKPFSRDWALGFEPKKAARQAYEQSGLGPEDVQVIELHDCFSTNELITYEALRLCPEGRGGELIDSGAVNPSGGLISKGHPLGATGLAQCAELTDSCAARLARVRSKSPGRPSNITSVWAGRRW